MIEIRGEYFKHTKDNDYNAYVCTTNTVLKKDGSLVMGAGIAKEFANLYKSIPKKWGREIQIREEFNREKSHIIVTPMSYYVEKNIYVYGINFMVAFPTKHHWKDPSDINLIIKSSKGLKYFADCMGWSKVLMTRPGCGCGGLNWSDVKREIEPYLDDRFYVIDRG